MNLSIFNSNCTVRNCEFWERDKGTNGMFSHTVTTNAPTTLASQWTSAAIFTRSAGCANLLVFDNLFNGNPSLTNVNTSSAGVDACDGLLWVQGTGNTYASRNAITNYALEAIQLNSGPSAVAANVYSTLVSVEAACALHLNSVQPSATGSPDDYVFYFVGNEVTGGRDAVLGGNNGINEKRFHLHVGGNSASLYPALLQSDDYPGSLVAGAWIGLANVAGNTLNSGGHGIRWRDNCTNAIVLKNVFANATFRALSYDGTNGAARDLAVLKNQLGQGSSYHLKVRPQEAGSYFLWQNSYYSSNGVAAINPFIDFAGAPVHIIP